jgi:OHCU decarboxylase
MTFNLNYLNGLTQEQARAALFHCCGSTVFADTVNAGRPFSDEGALKAAVELGFTRMQRADWLEAFTHHPQIGDVDSIRKKFAATAHLASNEQSGVAGASEQVFQDLAVYNRKYLDKFGFIFIICATGKSADFMLQELKRRYDNQAETELHNAAGEQKKITWLRLAKAGAA